MKQLVPYLSREWYFYGHRNDLSQQAAVEGHHGCSRVVVGEHQRHLDRHAGAGRGGEGGRTYC